MDEKGQGAERKRMISTQLQARDIADPRVLDAMFRVPRHEFVREEDRAEAYGDFPLPIGDGQTISQPYIVAFMSQALALTPGDRVLEIGTGCGYQAAVLAELGAEVHTVEIVPDLARRARENLDRLGYGRVKARDGDGGGGWPEAAPFDAILSACALLRVPLAWLAQLAEGGRMIVPVGPEGGVQELVLIRKQEGQVREERVLPVRFVPMTGRQGGASSCEGTARRNHG